jgi:histidinol-phosphate aminotransferase
MAAAARRADLVWLCVPNNPTGLRDADDAIERVIAATAGIAVIDGAYAEFTGERWAPWLERHPNLVVLGTLSKAFAVAGARVGYSLSSPELAAELHRRRPPGSLSSLSAAIGERALADPAWAQANVAAVSAERERLAAELETRGFRTVPSVTNFILAEYGRGALDLAERLMWEDGLVVRTYATSPTLNLYLRFTVRSPAENDRLLAALDRRLP